MYILIAILVFGFMIFIHELGHFMFAKKFGVAINEFSIGMGPKIFSKQGKDGVMYSLRLLPIGGYVAMEGEDEESDHPDSYNKKAPWKRFIIVIAGAMMNILVSVLIFFIITLCTPRFGTTVIYDFAKDSTSDDTGLKINDKIVEINGANVYTAGDLSYEINMNGGEAVTVTVIRNGEKITLSSVRFPTYESQGVTFGVPDFTVYGENRSFSSVLKNTFHTCKFSVKSVWDSIAGLISGKYGLEQVSGPVGITDAMSTAAKTGGAQTFFYLVALIGMNLGIMNLLPIPALDGGTLLLTFIEMVTKKKLPPRIENGIRAVGFALIMLLAIVLIFKDTIFLIKRG